MSLELQQNCYQGRIAIGEKAEITNKSGSKVKIPKKLDYFIATKNFDPKTGVAARDLETTENLKKKYGTDKPKEIEIILVDDHYDTAFYTDYLNYPGKICNCKGNGQVAIRTLADGTKVNVKCDYEHCEFRLVKTNNGLISTCKPTGILTFILPEAARSGGVWKFVTHSNMTIGKIRGVLKNIYAAMSLQGLKIKMRVQVVQVNVPKQGTQNVPIVEVELPYSYDTLAQKLGAKDFDELIEKRKPIVQNVLPDQQRVQEIANAIDEGAAYDGSAEEVVPPTPSKAEEFQVSPPPTSDAPITDDEFHF